MLVCRGFLLSRGGTDQHESLVFTTTKYLKLTGSYFDSHICKSNFNKSKGQMDTCAAFLKCKLFTILTTINNTHVQTKPFSEEVMVVNEWKKKPKPKYSHTLAEVVELNTCVTGKIITQTSILFHLQPISKL